MSMNGNMHLMGLGGWGVGEHLQEETDWEGVGACPWDGSQVGPVIGWAFPQSLLHLLSLHFL